MDDITIWSLKRNNQLLNLELIELKMENLHIRKDRHKMRVENNKLKENIKLLNENLDKIIRIYGNKFID